LPIPPIIAVNTAADSDNKIHDDRVAAEYGFRGGLVPGVTVYGYLAAAAIDFFGETWLAQGAMHARFMSPVYEGDIVNVALHAEHDTAQVEIAGSAAGKAWLHDEAAPSPDAYEVRDLPQKRPPASHEALVPGSVLGTLAYRLDLTKSGMSAPLDPALGEARLAHPAVVLALANEVLARNVELGPWIHVASEVHNFRAVADGQEIEVRGRVTERFERKGHEFVVLDVAILADSQSATQVRHTAIWRPRH
jgi:hypothetical protein